MKTIAKYIALAALTLPVATGCVEETFPTSGATADQLGASSKATEAILWSMPAFLNNADALGRGSSNMWHGDYGYGSIMHIRDVMGQDMPIIQSNYDYYSNFERCLYLDEDYIYCGFVWSYYYKQIQTANNAIGAIDEESADDLQLSYLGVALAYRAFAYLEAAQMFEFKENDKVSGSPNKAGNNVVDLTIPIVTPETTPEDAANNPRVPHAEMVAFVEGDLDKAEEYIPLGARLSKTMPDLTAVYGLKARLYMWDGQYAKAAEYARKAIDLGKYSPVTRSQWLDVTTGFNTLSNQAWIWGAQQSKEDDVVQTGIINWTSWMAPEATYGYASAGPMAMIDAKLYSEISDKDWRKLSFIAPEGSPLEGQTPLIDPTIEFEAYVGVKFRPAEGNTDDYSTASATAYPLMRIEEMYFIEAEATAQQGNIAGAKALIEAFMQQYRYAEYACPVDDKDGVVTEILRQKRIEFWGEGISFFDIKRLNIAVDRQYEGTNFYNEAAMKTTTRPAWMNICITRGEKNNNTALIGYENDSPNGVYTPLM